MINYLKYIFRDGGFGVLVGKKANIDFTVSGFSSFENAITEFIQSFSASGCIIPTDKDLETSYSVKDSYSLRTYFEDYPYQFSKKYDVNEKIVPAFDIYTLHMAICHTNIHKFESWTYYYYTGSRELHFGFKTKLDLIMAKLLL